MSSHPSFDTSGDSLDDFKFTFESYLDGSSRIEPDVSCTCVTGPPAPSLCTHPLTRLPSPLPAVNPCRYPRSTPCACCPLPSHVAATRRSCDRESASLTESIFEYYKENGRTYHSYRAGCKSSALWSPKPLASTVFPSYDGPPSTYLVIDHVFSRDSLSISQ